MGLFGRKKSNPTLSGIISDPNASYTTSTRPRQQGTLALPTKLDEVVKAVHESVPTQLPGGEASQDEVRYFLFQILTLKEYDIARKHPQWVLETCMWWCGGGYKLRSLPLTAYQQLCPLGPGIATIDWTAKDLKFPRQDMPPCDVRFKIGKTIKHIVTSLTTKENGHQQPGWQVSIDAQPNCTGKMQDFASPSERDFSQATFTGPYSLPYQRSLYGLSNHTLPLLHQMPSAGVQLHPYHMRYQLPCTGPPYRPSGAGSVQGTFNSKRRAYPAPNDAMRHQDSPPISSSTTPSPSYCQAESISSQLSQSTARTSPPSSEDENYIWAAEASHPRAVAQRVAGGACVPTEMFQAAGQRTSTARPTRYKATDPSSAAQSSERSYDPVHRMAHLRSGPYSKMPTVNAMFEACSSPSNSTTNRHESRQSSAMPSEMTESSSRQHPLLYPMNGTNVSSTYSMQSYPTSTRSDTATTMNNNHFPQSIPATPMFHSHTSLARPWNNYKVDTHAFDSAENIGFKLRPDLLRLMPTGAKRNRGLARGRSEGGLCHRTNNISFNVRDEEESVGPSLRFQNPRTEQPGLTIYETIDAKEKLGKQHVEDQRRVELWQGRGLTVYETIQEKGKLDGKPQRGMNTSVGRNWPNYF